MLPRPTKKEKKKKEKRKEKKKRKKKGGVGGREWGVGMEEEVPSKAASVRCLS